MRRHLVRALAAVGRGRKHEFGVLQKGFEAPLKGREVDIRRV